MNLQAVTEASVPPPGAIRPGGMESFLENLRLEGRGTIREIGSSREGRPLHGLRIGSGPLRISIVAGAHADEPGGPLGALTLARWLVDPAQADLLDRTSWTICPNVNPDGTERNKGWLREVPRLEDYVRHAARELPGDDVEFNYPSAEPLAREPRPENHAVADFLRETGPVHLHASLHGMAFAFGAWWLIEKGWVDRTGPLRRQLRRLFEDAGWGLHDMDRRGEKGFHRIEEGFCTTPSATAMREHFLSQGDPGTAQLFLPSSMEFARSLGGDPLCMVSELPIFRIARQGPDATADWESFRTESRAARERLIEGSDDSLLRQLAARWRPVPVPLSLHARTLVAAIAGTAEFLLPS